MKRLAFLPLAALAFVACTDQPTEPVPESSEPVASFDPADVDCDDTLSDGADIQDAIDDEGNDTICLEAGTYEPSETLGEFRDGMSLVGLAGSEEVIIDVSAASNRGIDVDGVEDVRLEGFTVEESGSGVFGLKIQFVDGLDLEDVVARDNGRTGIDLNKVDNAVLLDTEAHGNGGVGIAVRDSDDVVVHRAKTRSNAWGGLALWSMDEEELTNVTITGSSFEDEPAGVLVQHGGAFENIALEDNELSGNTVGLLLEGGDFGEPDATGFSLHYNNIEGNDEFGVLNAGEGILDATNNWWGHPGGPQRPVGNDRFRGPRGADRVSENVEFQPWLNDAFAWQVADEEGLRLWLDASAIEGADGRPVGSWKDLSGEGNHAKQDEEDYQPTLALDGLDGDASAVRFEGNEFMAVDPILDPSDDHWTIFIVVAPEEQGNQDVWQQLDGTGEGRVNVSIRRDDGLQYSSYLGGSQRYSGIGIGDADHVVQRWDGETLAWWVNGEAGDTHGPTMEAADGGYHIGTSKRLDNWLDADVAEIILFDRSLGDVERRRIEEYLNEKY